MFKRGIFAYIRVYSLDRWYLYVDITWGQRIACRKSLNSSEDDSSYRSRTTHFSNARCSTRRKTGKSEDYWYTATDGSQQIHGNRQWFSLENYYISSICPVFFGWLCHHSLTDVESSDYRSGPVVRILIDPDFLLYWSRSQTSQDMSQTILNIGYSGIWGTRSRVRQKKIN